MAHSSQIVFRSSEYFVLNLDTAQPRFWLVSGPFWVRVVVRFQIRVSVRGWVYARAFIPSQALPSPRFVNKSAARTLEDLP